MVEFLNLARGEIAAARQAQAQKRQKKPKEQQEKKQSIRKQLTDYNQQEIERKYGMVGECRREVR